MRAGHGGSVHSRTWGRSDMTGVRQPGGRRQRAWRYSACSLTRPTWPRILGASAHSVLPWRLHRFHGTRFPHLGTSYFALGAFLLSHVLGPLPVNCCHPVVPHALSRPHHPFCYPPGAFLLSHVLGPLLVPSTSAIVHISSTRALMSEPGCEVGRGGRWVQGKEVGRGGRGAVHLAHG